MADKNVTYDDVNDKEKLLGVIMELRERLSSVEAVVRKFANIVKHFTHNAPLDSWMYTEENELELEDILAQLGKAEGGK